MKRFLAGTALRVVIASGAALGTAAGAQTASSGASAGDMNAIVVTAQRREQSAQDVGIALSVLSSDDLIRRGVTSINDLQQATPNLEIEPAFGSGNAQFRIRGVGFTDYASNNSPTVGVYVNEVAYPIPVMTQGLIFDIARVEVLRGPQGTLYGRNTTGGAINFITNKPTADFHAGLTAEYGRFNAFKGEAYVSGPIAPGLNFRIAGSSEQGGGYQHDRTTGRGLGDADKVGGRALLSYDSGTGLTILAEAHGGYDHSENVGLYLLDPLQTHMNPTTLGPLIPADRNHFNTGWDIPPSLVRDAGLKANGKPGRHNRTIGASINQSYDFGLVKFTSITSWDDLHRAEYGDWDASSSIEADVFFGSRVSVVSQEARFSSNGTGPLTWTAGAYYSQQQLDERYFSDFTDLLGNYARVSYSQEVHSIAGFGQLEYALSSKLKLTGGLRYEDETRKLEGFNFGFGGVGNLLPPTDTRTRMTPLSGKVAVEYKPVANLLLYASASKGVKSGGFTAYNSGSVSGIAPFKPERLYAYEVGFKADINRMVQINGAAFYYDYRDQQVQDYVCGANGPVGKFVNARKSRIYGFEGDMRIEPVRGLTLSPYASYKSGKFLDFGGLDLDYCRQTLQSRYIDKSGTRISFPKVEAGGTLAYDIALGGGDYVLTPSATASYRSTYYSPLHIARFDIPGYVLVDADLTLRPAKGGWSASLWGRNIFNKSYDLTRNFFTSANIAQPGRPATYGVRVGFHY
jgi:outer membrane receptor protein involved in Fe transport